MVLVRWINGAYLVASLLVGYSLKDQPIWIEVRGASLTISLGWIIPSLMMVLFIVFRAGPAWSDSGAADLAIAGVHYEPLSSSFWVEIRNGGLFDSGVIKVWIARAVNSKGSEANATSLPILIGILSHGVMTKGNNTVKFGTISLVDKFFPCLTVSSMDPSDPHRGVAFQLSGAEWADSANRIYINVSLSHESRRVDAWYELQTIGSVSPHIAISAVRGPLRENHIRRQRAKLGIAPAKQSPESTTHAD
jgi:hypothetical protein